MVKSPSGAKIHEKQQMRIQAGHFLKIVLNLDLTLSDDGECPALLISCGIIDLGAFCIELWPFFVSKRISVPMSYISVFDAIQRSGTASTIFNAIRHRSDAIQRYNAIWPPLRRYSAPP